MFSNFQPVIDIGFRGHAPQRSQLTAFGEEIFARYRADEGDPYSGMAFVHRRFSEEAEPGSQVALNIQMVLNSYSQAENQFLTGQKHILQQLNRQLHSHAALIPAETRRELASRAERALQQPAPSQSAGNRPQIMQAQAAATIQPKKKADFTKSLILHPSLKTTVQPQTPKQRLPIPPDRPAPPGRQTLLPTSPGEQLVTLWPNPQQVLFELIYNLTATRQLPLSFGQAAPSASASPITQTVTEAMTRTVTRAMTEAMTDSMTKAVTQAVTEIMTQAAAPGVTFTVAPGARQSKRAALNRELPPAFAPRPQTMAALLSRQGPALLAALTRAGQATALPALMRRQIGVLPPAVRQLIYSLISPGWQQPKPQLLAAPERRLERITRSEWLKPLPYLTLPDLPKAAQPVDRAGLMIYAEPRILLARSLPPTLTQPLTRILQRTLLQPGPRQALTAGLLTPLRQLLPASSPPERADIIGIHDTIPGGRQPLLLTQTPARRFAPDSLKTALPMVQAVAATPTPTPTPPAAAAAEIPALRSAEAPRIWRFAPQTLTPEAVEKLIRGQQKPLLRQAAAAAEQRVIRRTAERLPAQTAEQPKPPIVAPAISRAVTRTIERILERTAARDRLGQGLTVVRRHIEQQNAGPGHITLRNAHMQYIAKQNTTQQNLSQQNISQQSASQQNISQQSASQPSIYRQSVLQQSIRQYGILQTAAAQMPALLAGTAWRNTVQQELLREMLQPAALMNIRHTLPGAQSPAPVAARPGQAVSRPAMPAAPADEAAAEILRLARPPGPRAVAEADMAESAPPPDNIVYLRRESVQAAAERWFGGRTPVPDGSGGEYLDETALEAQTLNSGLFRRETASPLFAEMEEHRPAPPLEPLVEDVMEQLLTGANMNQLADRVYEAFERRIKSERRRFGL